MSLLYFAGTLLGYILNKNYTFKRKDYRKLEFAKYFISYSMGYLLNLIILFYFVDLLSFPHQFVQLFATLIVAIFIFLLLRFFVFIDKINGNY